MLKIKHTRHAIYRNYIQAKNSHPRQPKNRHPRHAKINARLVLFSRLPDWQKQSVTVKAQYKNYADFGMGASCSYDLLARALGLNEYKQVALKGSRLSGK